MYMPIERDEYNGGNLFNLEDLSSLLKNLDELYMDLPFDYNPDVIIEGYYKAFLKFKYNNIGQ